MGECRELSAIHQMASRLSKADRDELERLIAQRAGNKGKVVSMRAESRGIVNIMTGIRHGPRSGIGRVLRATRLADGWRIEEVGGWRS